MALHYEPLNEAKDEIRLLTLHAGELGTPIRCSVSNVPLGEFSIHEEGIYQWSGKGAAWHRPRPQKVLDATASTEDGAADPQRWYYFPARLPTDPWVDTYDLGAEAPNFFGAEPDMTGLSVVPEFEALSYTWGDMASTVPIDVNGVSFPVTLNLFGALQRLRKKGRDRVLWVDALCINQLDIDERSKQVKRMPSIYQRAQKVVVWLTDGAGGSERALELLQMLGGKDKDILNLSGFADETDDLWNGPQYLRGGENWGPGMYDERDKNRRESLRLLGLADPNDFKSDDWKALEHLFLNCDYWYRSWIVQELTYARSIKFYCGSRSITSIALDRIFNHTDSLGNLETSAQTNANRHLVSLLVIANVFVLVQQNKDAKHWFRLQGHERGGTSLLQLLVKFRRSKSSDPRDKIYALLGLPSISDTMHFHTLDYGMSPAVVFKETTRSIIGYENSLRVLCLEHPDPNKRDRDLPSWCPQWALPLPAFDDHCLSRILPGETRWPDFKASAESVPQAYEKGISTGDDSEQDKRQIWIENVWSVSLVVNTERRKGFPASTGTTYRITPEQAHNDVLVLDGIECGKVARVYESIPSSAVGENTDGLKTTALQWQDTLGDDELRNPRSFDKVDKDRLITQLLTILKGSIWLPPKREDGPPDWSFVLFEKYFVWSGILDVNDATTADFYEEVESIENIIWDSARGWTFGFVSDGEMAMLPTRSKEGDVIAVLFGGDIPFVLRPIQRDESQSAEHEGDAGTDYELIGTAYVSGGLMKGKAMESFEAGEKERKTFRLR